MVGVPGVKTLGAGTFGTSPIFSTFSESIILENNGTSVNNIIAHVTAHETGHQMDHIYNSVFGGAAGTNYFSQSAAWQAAVAIDETALAANASGILCSYTETRYGYMPTQTMNVDGYFGSDTDRKGNNICSGGALSAPYAGNALQVAEAAFSRLSGGPKPDANGVDQVELFAELIGARYFPDSVNNAGASVSGSDNGAGLFVCSEFLANFIAQNGRLPTAAENTYTNQALFSDKTNRATEYPCNGSASFTSTLPFFQ